jgi:hypothetical protein
LAHRSDRTRLLRVTGFLVRRSRAQRPPARIRDPEPPHINRLPARHHALVFRRGELRYDQLGEHLPPETVRPQQRLGAAATRVAVEHGEGAALIGGEVPCSRAAFRGIGSAIRLLMVCRKVGDDCRNAVAAIDGGRHDGFVFWWVRHTQLMPKLALLSAQIIGFAGIPTLSKKLLRRRRSPSRQTMSRRV